jgi:hypothetical protein
MAEVDVSQYESDQKNPESRRYEAGIAGHLSTPSKIANAIPPLW